MTEIAIADKIFSNQCGEFSFCIVRDTLDYCLQMFKYTSLSTNQGFSRL
ncbi:hypothetical protein SCA6_000975, partial [Theobroma cacao]